VALWVLLRKLADSGISVLVTTHEISIAGQFMDRAVLIARGRMRASDSPSKVFTPELLSDAYGIPLDVIAGPGSTPLVVPHLKGGGRKEDPGGGTG
jgi:iron complex transport system ATP-binding protein